MRYLYQEISKYLSPPPFPRQILKQRGDKYHFLAGRPNLQKITLKKSRLRRAKSLYFPLYMPSKPQNFRACGGQIPAFPLVYALKTKKNAPAAGKFLTFPPCIRSDNPEIFTPAASQNTVYTVGNAVQQPAAGAKIFGVWRYVQGEILQIWPAAGAKILTSDLAQIRNLRS